MCKRRFWRGGITLATLFLLVQVIWWAEPLAVFDVLQWASPNVVWRVPTTRPMVALSFDDGPHPEHTPDVLAILAEHRAHATFFLIGERAAAHAELLAAIRAGGHEVGNHYLHRGSTLGDSTAAFSAKLTRAEQIIGLARSPKLFRPPGGLAWPWQLRAAREVGYTCVLGSAYPHDPAHPPARYIRWLITKNMAPGSIVILHDGIADPSRSIQALPEILAEGGRRGMRFVTVGELLAAEQANGAVKTRSVL